METDMKNIKKHEKYANLMTKLKNAIENEYYYEAIFIEYAILEDRFSSLCEHMKIHIDERTTLDDKIKIIKNDKSFETDEYVKKHLTKELFDQIYIWKSKRNKLVHRLVDLNYCNEDIKNVALFGNGVVKIVNNKSTLVNKHFDKMYEEARERLLNYSK